jgi:hypothetical protein
MTETSTNYVSKREFRLVGLGQAALIVVALWFFIFRPFGVVAPPAKGSDSPILVRGGAMTAFTVSPTAPGGWTTGKSGQHCVDLITTTNDTFSVVLTNEAEHKQDGTYGLSAGGEVDFKGKDGVGFSLMLYQRNCLQTNSTNFSVEATPIKGALFYKAPLNTPGTHTGNLRFYNPGGCVGSDEELCERMAEVDVSGAKQPTLSCGDGDCSAVIEIEH